ncbi:nucleolar complex protein 3 homolog [Xenia sp. Carnegie-2017]|uniref:nucleolar complex protein 3 homolog n=1 Tax=Xenia sp. Carnegie-2017 TaxID=2897299 RepID=UPI001F04F515|nr:nucleolar complex protein 3 homolog [Xenia sp. Carnegie-2017]
MSVLKNLVNSEDVSTNDKLHCILTAFKILSDQGEALNIDLRTFYSYLYSSLVGFHSDHDMKTVLECLNIMISKRRKQVSIQRLLAYVKRLCTVALYNSIPNSLSLLCYAKLFLQMNAKSDIVLCNDSALNGQFFPDIIDPEYSNADNTSLWELTLFRKHYNMTVRNYASHISLGIPDNGHGSLTNQLSRKTPINLMEDFTEDKLLEVITEMKSLPKKSLKRRTWTEDVNDFVTRDIKKYVNDCMEWLKKQS